MNSNIIEKDAVVFLGLMAIANKNFDQQFKHTDGETTHTQGLNIFAAIIDNIDGEVIGQQQNSIHAHCNPMLHAEQLTLKEAIEKLNTKRPRNPETTSVENYYRKFLFNQPDTVGNFNVGSTIYTTLEPCPFCTSALLVNRMKRIVYIIPDATYGNSYNYLKENFYKKYDITYGSLSLNPESGNNLISFADKQLKVLLEYVQSHSINATLYLDSLKPFLEECSRYFLGLKESDLITSNEEKAQNLKTLLDLQTKAS
jgi:tRNA(Arg) A34 adenosine deaminase TadA